METKKILILVFSVFFIVVAQAQNVYINGESHYYGFLCANSSMEIEISTDFIVVVDSIRIYEYESNDCVSFSAPTKRVGLSYTWMIPESGFAQSSCYRYLIQIFSGVDKFSALADIIVLDLPNAQLSASTSTICAGETVAFTASGGSNYEFKINGIGVQSGSSNVFSPNLLNNGDIVVVEVSENGCSATSMPITMTVNPLPDLTSLTPHSTCNGAEMRFDYQGLTGTGPWTVSFWNSTHNTQYGVDYNVTNPNGSLDVSLPFGLERVDVMVTNSTGCSNFKKNKKK